MKKLMLTVILTASLLMTACSDKETTAEDTKTSYVLSENVSVSETESNSYTEVKTDETVTNTETENSAEQTAIKESSVQEQNNNSSESTAETESPEKNDIESIGSTLFEKSCQITWDMLIDCPYTLNYSDKTSSGAVLIDDPDVTCLDDVINDYCSVFASPNNGLYEKYFEAENGVYCFDGGRGADRTYKYTKLELVSQSETEAVFNAVSFHEDPDTGESGDNETNEFVIIKSDGEWKTKTFTLPY